MMISFGTRTLGTLVAGVMLGLFVLVPMSTAGTRGGDATLTRGVIQSVNPAARTLSVSGVTLKVTGRSILLDSEGRKIRLGRLNTPSSRKGADGVQYSARKQGRYGDNEVIELQVMKSPMR